METQSVFTLEVSADAVSNGGRNLNKKIASQIKDILVRIPDNQEAYFRNYFSNAPDAVLNAIRIEKICQDHLLTEENEPIEKIYVLMEGVVKAIDYRVKGSAYEYARFEAVTVIGSMECVFGIQEYITTLVTSTPCTLLVIPRSVYESWLWEDTNALRAEAQSMRSYLLDRTRESRVMILLNGAERLVYVLIKECKKVGSMDEYILSINRQELADQCGFSVKTVNRSLKKLEEDGLLSKNGHKIRISQSQYIAMKEYLDSVSGLDER